MSDTLSSAAVSSALPGWSVLAAGVHATFRTGSFAAGAELIRRVTELAEAANHHPDVDLRYGLVHLRLFSHDVSALSQRDVDLARQITTAADDLGIPIVPDRPRVTEIAIDALDIPAVRPFWRVVMGYEDRGEDLVDPDGIGPLLWFQQMDAPRPQRNRIHVDVWVDPDIAERRVADTVAAGGRIVNDEPAPSFWVLADPEGNEACLCTWRDRG